MTEKLKCCFCGHELVAYPYKQNGVLYDVCRNPRCKYDGWHFPTEIWHALIDGKKAQRQLRTTKDRCVKKIKAKEREIANYLNGINVRNKEIETLHEQLQKVQDELKKTQAGLYCGHCVKTAESSQRWSEAIFFAKNFIGHGINSNTSNYSESNCRWALNEIDKILSGITKQEE